MSPADVSAEGWRARLVSFARRPRSAPVQRPLASSVAVPVLAVITALAMGAVLIVVSDQAVLGLWASDPLSALGASWTLIANAYGALFAGSIGDPIAMIGATASADWPTLVSLLDPLSETLLASTPLIFTGLAVALGFRAGLFNIGAEGQLYVGALFAAFVGFTVTGLPLAIHLPLALAAGFVGGALWAGIAGLLKVRTGANEVITTMMLNFVAYRLVDLLLKQPFYQRPGRDDPVSRVVADTAQIPAILEGLRLHWGFGLALIGAGIVSWLLFRSTIGFEVRGIGLNPVAARFAGMSIFRTILVTLLASGGLAGLAGTVEILGVNHTINPGFSPGYGWDAIVLALMAGSRPLGVVGAALLFGALRAGATQMQASTGIPIDLVGVIQALVIVFVAAPALIRGIYRLKARLVGVSATIVQGIENPGGGPASPVRRRALGLLSIGIALLVALLGLQLDGSVTTKFDWNLGGGFLAIPVIEIPSAPATLILAGLCAAAALAILAKDLPARTFRILGAAIALAAMIGFLAWAVAGTSMNVTGVLQSTVQRSVPITLGALGALLCERAGVMNVGIEGIFLFGAFAGAFIGSASSSPWLGLLAAVLLGGALSWLIAILAIRYSVDQIVAGFAVNILALGLTGFLSARVLEPNPQLNTPERFTAMRLPVLSDLPIVGPVVFSGSLFVYLMLALVMLVHFGLFYTRWGLRVRAVGEHPRAAATAGIDVLRVRYRNMILGGMVAGLGGAFFTLGATGGFDRNMTAGRGFIGLAAMIFGGWQPIGALLASLVFGFSDALQTRLSVLNSPVPSDLLLMVPYVVTIVAVAGFVGRVRAPAADGKPYRP